MSVDTHPRTSRLPGARRRDASAAEPAPATPVPPRLPGRRNPRWIAFGVLALCLGGLLSYAVYARVATERTVLAVAGTVYRGEVVEAADLTSVTLHGDLTGQTVPAEQRSSVVGKRAVFDLPAGSLVGPASVTDAVVPRTGSAVVGLRLATGKAPAALLVPAAPVRIVALPPPSNGTGSSDALAGKTYLGRVVDQTPGPDGTSVVVDVEVTADQAPTIALLAASERVALVRDAGR